jgi:hypothetical protein
MAAMGSICRFALVAAIATSLLGGCEPTSQAPRAANGDAPLQPQGTPVAHTGEHVLIPTGPDNKGLDPSRSFGKSECGDQLQDLSGALIQYYSLHKSMPAKLEDLAPLADPGAPLKFACPKSGKPYGYSPGGLVAPGKSSSIVIYDASPDHNGYRWCVFVHPSGVNQIVTNVVPVKEDMFRQYSPAVQ